MPSYSWLLEQNLTTDQLQAKLKAMQQLGVPYSDEEIAQAPAHLQKQAKGIVAQLAEEGVKVAPNKEIVAMIAYLQRLGTDIKKEQNVQAQN
jgi:cytochrome c oxidase cbb3-type subunit I/II